MREVRKNCEGNKGAWDVVDRIREVSWHWLSQNPDFGANQFFDPLCQLLHSLPLFQLFGNFLCYPSLVVSMFPKCEECDVRARRAADTGQRVLWHRLNLSPDFGAIHWLDLLSQISVSAPLFQLFNTPPHYFSSENSIHSERKEECVGWVGLFSLALLINCLDHRRN